MELKLRELFDYQQFEQDPRLKAMLDAANDRAGFAERDEGELSDDDVDGVVRVAGSLDAHDSSDLIVPVQPRTLIGVIVALHRLIAV